MKFLLLTDIPAPWREKVFENVHHILGDDFHVAYCGLNEQRRLWKFPHGSHSKQFLRCFRYFLGGGDRFFNPGIIPLLLRQRPKVVIIFGFKDPTMLLAYIVAKSLGSVVIVFSDTWLGRDKRIGRPQRILRKVIFQYFGDVFLGASQKTLEMYRHYNPEIPSEALFQSSLCADNEFFRNRLKGREIQRSYDIIFSGRIVAGKNPVFLAEVAVKIKQIRGRCRVLLIGEGDQELKVQMFNILKENGVEYHFAGFVAHQNLPDYYAQARLLLLPTSEDCWGVVINEAMISGTPVITTNMTAAAFELVQHRQNGLILPMDQDVWSKEISFLLDTPSILQKYSNRSKEAVSVYSFNNAACGMVDAIQHAEHQQN